MENPIGVRDVEGFLPEETDKNGFMNIIFGAQFDKILHLFRQNVISLSYSRHIAHFKLNGYILRIDEAIILLGSFRDFCFIYTKE